MWCCLSVGVGEGDGSVGRRMCGLRVNVCVTSGGITLQLSSLLKDLITDVLSQRHVARGDMIRLTRAHCDTQPDAQAKYKSRVKRERSFSLSAFASVTVYGCSDTLRLLWAIPWPGELRGHP